MTAVVAALIAGCATDAGQKEQAGAVVGAILGGLFGGAAAGGRHRTAGVVLGALAGGLVGGQVGRYFDEQDRKRIAEAADRALRENSTQTYVSPKSRASVTMTPGQSTFEPGRSIRALPTVYTATSLRAESRAAYVTRDMAAKATPSADGANTATLAYAEQVEIVGIVPDNQYRLIARDGVAVGYLVESDMVASQAEIPPRQNTQVAGGPDTSQKPSTAKPVAKAATKRSPRKPTPPTPAPELSTVAEVKPVQSASTLAATPAEPKPMTSPPAEIKTVALTKECKVLDYDFALPDGQRFKGSQKSCYEPPAGWQAVTT